MNHAGHGPTVAGAQRRQVLRSACRWCAGLAALASPALSALAQTGVPRTAADGRPLPPLAEKPVPLGPDGLPARFERPALDTDEGGLWAMMDREEARLRRSQFLVRDAALSKYAQNLVCGLMPDHCPDIRVYVVRTPLFNASMAPNGMMQIWSGLLLRVENEAQLAAVVGHEIGHYLERHTLERLRDLRSRAAFAQFMGMFGLVGAIGSLGVLASAFAFSREQEARADRLGMRLMQRAGYDGRQAARVWDNLTGELKVTQGDDAGKRSPMMATHPPSLERRDDLLKLAGEAGGKVGIQEYRQIIATARMSWLQDEIRRGQFEESVILFDRLLAQQPDDGEVLYARGEVLRQRAGATDQNAALVSLEQAARLPGAPAETFRALGLIYKQRVDPVAAVSAFERYLGAAPQAPDASLIQSYLTELKP